MRSLIKASVATVFGALVASGCGAPATTAAGSATVAPRPAQTDRAILLARPMKLPEISAGSACPVSAVAPISTAVTNPRGKGPLYFGGPLPQGGFAFNKMVYTTVGASGPILLRGGRIDGVGVLKFSGSPADASEKAEIPPLPGGAAGSGTWAFYTAVLDPGSSNALYVYPATRGCFAIQVDAPTFEELIILQAS
jgi:hypothetical protein